MDLLVRHHDLVATLFAFAFGAVVGSFLNVVIARVPHGQSVVSPGSHCPKCGTPIAWYDNVPVLAWLWLRGRCRRCGLPISIRYPLVELLVGLLAVAVWRSFGFSGAALGYFVFVAALVALAYIDLDTWLLPHEITWPLLGAGLLSPLWNPALGWKASLLGGAIGFGGFAAVALFGEKVLKKEVMGWGDVWLLGGIGAWMGWQSLLPVVLLSAFQGAVVGGVLLAVGKPAAERERQPVEGDEDWVPPPHAVPYGPFLVLAALEELFIGAWLRGYYDRLLTWLAR
jgi:leader peptidase (prepilin peptidase)/N-methyltransferase